MSKPDLIFAAYILIVLVGAALAVRWVARRQQATKQEEFPPHPYSEKVLNPTRPEPILNEKCNRCGHVRNGNYGDAWCGRKLSSSSYTIGKETTTTTTYEVRESYKWFICDTCVSRKRTVRSLGALVVFGIFIWLLTLTIIRDGGSWMLVLFLLAAFVFLAARALASPGYLREQIVVAMLDRRNYDDNIVYFPGVYKNEKPSHFL